MVFDTTIANEKLAFGDIYYEQENAYLSEKPIG